VTMLSACAFSSAAVVRTTPPVMAAGQPMRKAGWFPGAVAPSYLDGSMPGDVGFDPLALVALAPVGMNPLDPGDKWTGLGFDTESGRKNRLVMMDEYEKKRKVAWMREAEIKHARLAMVAAAGWPLSELFNQLMGGWPLAATAGRAPSVLNGHLFEGPQGIFVLLVALATSYLELQTLDNVEGLTPTGYVAGDLGFDPAGLRSKRADMETAEIKNGRLAMLAVTGFAIQEFLYGSPVVVQSPSFFHPPGLY